jgi:transposase
MAMHRFIDGEDRTQQALLPHRLEDYVDGENPVRVIEVFIDELDLAALGFSGVTPAATGRPAYHPSTLLKIYLYGYLDRVQSSRRLEREAQRNIELMWLTERLAPDFKTIADFRKEGNWLRPSSLRQLFCAASTSLNTSRAPSYSRGSLSSGSCGAARWQRSSRSGDRPPRGGPGRMLV